MTVSSCEVGASFSIAALTFRQCAIAKKVGNGFDVFSGRLKTLGFEVRTNR